MRVFQISERAMRNILIGFLLIVPALTLWNLYADAYGKHKIFIGRRLSGFVEEPQPVALSYKSFSDGSWQKFITTNVTDEISTRPLLIRLSNNIRVALFGHYGSDQVSVGDKGHLIERAYLKEYCSRDLNVLKARSAAWISELKELQDFYRAQGKIFIYLLTPSKMAHFPELFAHRYDCTSTEASRTQWLPVYNEMLGQAGINVVDTATLLHSLKGKYPIDMFPQGGVHWNQIGVAHAADALIGEINRQGFLPPLPRLKWSYTISEVATGIDRDLLDLVNVLLPNPRYPTPIVKFDNSAGCPAYPHRKIAFIGASFIDGPARVLNQNGCLPDLLRYNYLYRGIRGGEGYKDIKLRASVDDILELRTADIVILEENESVIGVSAHAKEFYRVIMGKK